MTNKTPYTSTKPASSIEHLRIYQLAQQLEDQVYDLVKGMPAERFYPLGNGLRRSSAAAAHYIAETHRRFSYSVKMDCLHNARSASEEAIALLEQYKTEGSADISRLVEDYSTLIKQGWGLIKYLKTKQTERQAAQAAQATDQLVAARS